MYDNQQTTAQPQPLAVAVVTADRPRREEIEIVKTNNTMLSAFFPPFLPCLCCASLQ